MISTVIDKSLGLEFPIFQGGMAWIAEHTLASAVSNAGGLGIIAGGSAPIDYLRDQIRQTKAAVNGKPFGVNIMLMSRRPRSARYRRGRTCRNNRCRQPRQVYGCMERSRHKGDTCRSVSCSCKENGKSRR